MSPAALIDEAVSRSEELFRTIGDRTHDGVGIVRASYGEGEQAAHDLLAEEARRLDLEVATDAALNLRMTLAGRDRNRAVIVGSHLDSAPRGGNYDGLAGVLAGLACARILRRRGAALDIDLSVMAIRSEENAWFGAQHVGSRAALGRLSAATLESAKRVDTGRSLADHMAAAGADLEPIRAGRPLVDTRSVAAYLECHIEQGPVLVERAVPIGIVTGIRGTLRCREAECVGEHGHAGVVPRRLRRDAVTAVSALAMRVDDYWSAAEERNEDLVVTIGRFATNPASHGLTTIPGEVSFCLDARSHSAETLERLWGFVCEAAADIADRRGVEFHFAPIAADAPVAMDASIRALLASSADELGIANAPIASGAGHDAGDFAAAGVPTGMVFIRNRNGSHNPAEAMDLADYAAAVRILDLSLAKLGGPRR